MTAPRSRGRVVLVPSAGQIELCMNRSIGHDWNREENQRWETGTSNRTVKLVGSCTRCQSTWYQLFAVNRRQHLLGKEGQRQYEYSDFYKARAQLDQGQLMYRRWASS